MTLSTTLSFSGRHHQEVYRHLFPGDGLEAAAILLCARTPAPRLRLLVRDVLLVPHDACQRHPDRIIWPGAWLERAFDRAETEGLVIVAIHSHPGSLFAFSEADDASDDIVLASASAATNSVCGSAIMTPDGAVRARLWRGDHLKPVDLVSVIGDDLLFWWDQDATPSGAKQRPMAFTGAMTAELARLSAGLIGASGTGSVSGEQLGRLGLGRVTPIDFDVVERKNLNRILNTGYEDVGRAKVDVLCEAIARHRGEGIAIPVNASLVTRAAVLAASQCDVLFCCVDTLEARFMADLISAAFLIPLFDVGVVIPTGISPTGPIIADVCGRIDYVRPDGASLQDRGVYSPDTLRAEYLRVAAPREHEQEIAAGYIRGLQEEAPAVITLNMRASAACVNEFIARAYPFRHEPNSNYARSLFSLAACDEDFFAECSFAASVSPMFARGDEEPLLGLPGLAS